MCGLYGYIETCQNWSCATWFVGVGGIRLRLGEQKEQNTYHIYNWRERFLVQ